jgi:phospholipase C
MSKWWPAVPALLALWGCSMGVQPAVPYMRGDFAMHALKGTGAGKIDHVVFIVQENRSYDNLFHG